MDYDDDENDSVADDSFIHLLISYYAGSILSMRKIW